MTLERRVGKLEVQLAATAAAARMRNLSGQPWESVVDAVCASVSRTPGGEALLEEIIAQHEAFAALPVPESREEGQPEENRHGLYEWMDGLQDGLWLLPEAIPEVVLRAYRDDHAGRQASGVGGSNLPFFRCLACGMAYPHFPPAGGWPGGRWPNDGNCLICGAAGIEVARMDLSRPFGTAWYRGDGIRTVRYIIRAGKAVPESAETTPPAREVAEQHEAGGSNRA